MAGACALAAVVFAALAGGAGACSGPHEALGLAVTGAQLDLAAAALCLARRAGILTIARFALAQAIGAYGMAGAGDPLFVRLPAGVDPVDLLADTAALLVGLLASRRSPTMRRSRKVPAGRTDGALCGDPLQTIGGEILGTEHLPIAVAACLPSLLTRVFAGRAASHKGHHKAQTGTHVTNEHSSMETHRGRPQSPWTTRQLADKR